MEEQQIRYVQAPGQFPILPIAVAGAIGIGALAAWKLGMLDGLLGDGGYVPPGYQPPVTPPGTPSCPAGYTYNPATQMCDPITVPPPVSGDADNIAYCATLGMTYDPATHSCVRPGGGGGVAPPAANTWSQSGHVVDFRYYNIAGAKVAFTNRATNVEYSTVSDSNGEWSFTNMPLGIYDLVWSAEGYGEMGDYYKDRNQAIQYEPQNLRLSEALPLLQLETLFLTKANATYKSRLGISAADDLGYSVYKWDLRTLLRELGYDAPDDVKIKVGAITGTITVGHGWWGYKNHKISYRLIGDDVVLSKGDPGESNCDKLESVAAPGKSDMSEIQLDTGRLDRLTVPAAAEEIQGAICDCRLTILCEWKE